MPPLVKYRGATLLLVVSIIMIIFGVMGVFGGLSSMATGMMSSFSFNLDENGIQYFRMIGALSILTGAVELVFGIFGIRFRNRGDKAGFVLVLGIIQIIVTVFATIYEMMLLPMGARVMEQINRMMEQEYGFTATDMNIEGLASNPVLIAVGFILPALFIVGALLNRMPPKQLYPK